ncbi:MAG TPA: S8 family serine peptidase [Candidatus Wunengus sp. YC61]|uniref:S8 family serine peptidase n=1 Tax=Candidatus Wunengus sp. YC61 TaxID=3367698 RepID=UPI004029A633
MGKWSLAQKFVLFLCIFFIFSDVAFSGGNDAIILPKYFIKMEREAKKGGGVEKKISGLLQLQIQLRKSCREQPTSERIKAMQRMGIKTAEIDKQLVYIHLKRKLNPSRIASLKEIGVIVYEDSWVPPLENHPTGYVMASMPIDRLYDVAKKPFIIRLETAEQVLLPKNDEAAKSIYANNVWEGYGYDGTGVRIAVLDSGLDTTHKDIPTPVVSKDYSSYPNVDDSIENQVTEHGTHVTGSALGRGTQSNGKYKGMAYGADLIFLKIGDDSAGGASTAAISAAIRDAVVVYNANIVTMSYGGFNTYNDGSEENCQAVDYAFSKGALVFMAAGNEADDGLHYSGTVTANITTDYIKVNVGSASQTLLYFYLNWFDGKGVNNNLDISLYDTNKNEMSTVPPFQAESPRGTESELIYLNADISGPATYYLKVKNNANNDQFFHIYSFSSDVTFENADPDYTINSPAAADNAIAVASYVSRTEWTNYKGENRHYITDNIIGKISSFSSHGPRIDGTKKPDIAAPGQGIISARDKIVTLPGTEDAYVIDNDGINDGNGPADYVLSQGTSMACPIAAGAAALLMQSNSSLKGNPESVRNALFQTASNNGEQNNTDGYGHLNVLNALNYIASTTPSSTPTLTPTPPPLPLPSTAPTQSPSPVRTQGKISGSVVNIKGNPIKSVKIKLKGITTKTLFTTLSDADGFFEFTGLEADTYSTIANKKGFKKPSKTVVLEEGEEKEIEIKMRKAKKIRNNASLSF